MKDPLNAIIRGRVVRADNGQPIEGARITLPTAGPAVALSDSEGRFELTKLRAGAYSLTAYADGFPLARFGSRGTGDTGRSLTVGPGQVINGIDFALQRGAVLSGVVVDEHGEPLALAPVWVLRQQFVNGERRLVRGTDTDPKTGLGDGGDFTDDRGRFRIFGLAPGTYFLAAMLPDPSSSGSATLSAYDLSAPALYPTGGPVAEAKPLTVAAGQELAGLSFAVTTVRTANINVMLSSRNGPWVGDVAIEQVGGYRSSGRTDANGRYSFSRRPPGTYRVFARDGDQVGFARVDLNGEDVLVPLTLTRGATVRGRVVTDADSPDSPPASDVMVLGRLLQAPGDVAATVKPDLTFELTGVTGPLHLTGSAKGGWFTRQLLVNGSDVTGLPLDTSRDLANVQIVLTQKVVGLTGTVRDDKGRAAADTSVVVFAEDPEKRWPGTPYLRSARTDAEGRYTLRGVPPGRYRAVAVPFLENGEESNPDLPTQLDSASTPVTLTNGVTATLNLRLVAWP